uniref:Leucine-rich repeat-containing N-terminal plant-type domain-containing protein n=1 Tax=Quercus lobata TaxID=97700 RepID=A0A7N2LVJ4_QUELO
MGRSLVKWLLWGLIVLVHLHGHRGCFEEERMSLLEIKEEFVRSTPNATIRYYLPTSPARVYILPSWVDDYKSECCEWERVTCNSTTGHVTHLSLHNIWEFDIELEESNYYFSFKDMVWFLNVSLFESLKELRSLDLSFNGIGGWIEHKGSESLLRLNKLESLDLDANVFNQSIIQSLRLLTSLKNLNLSSNALEGSLPTKELSVFEDLEILDLSNNWLNGSETVQGCFEEGRMGLLEIKEEFVRSTTNVTIRDHLLPSWVDDHKSEGREWERVTRNSTTGHVTHLFSTISGKSNGLIISISCHVLVQLHGHKGCFEEERMGLLEIKKFVRSSPNVTNHLLPSWVDDHESDCCEWERVTCNITTGHVTHLSLHNIRDFIEYDYYEKHNAWFLNVSLFETFKELRSLNLSSNYIVGWVENEGSVSLLRLKKLERLDLGSNGFKRSIIQSLRLLKSLKTLSLQSNRLEGSFPTEELSVFEDLEKLDLSYNKLNGSLTIQDFKNLSKLSKLKHLDLGGNHFDKGILRSLGALSALTSLKLDYTQMEGPLYDQDFASLRSLEVLNLGGNNFNGSLPKYLANLRSLEVLNLGVNNFNGSFPKCLCGLKKLEELDLSWNSFEGTLPSCLYNLTSLQQLDLKQNQFRGSTGICGLKKLEELDLSGNSFEGTLPSCLCNLTSLQQLDLKGNQFRGNISSLIAGLTSLKYIDLNHNLFEGLSFGSFANHSKLELFQFECLDNEKFDIETENSDWVPLFQLESLVISNCSLNKLSHQLPTFLFHQHSLRKLDLSHNGLKGPFPDWLFRNNTRLKSAFLNHNSFTGHFHLPLCLNSTYVIDMSNNQLNGKLQRNIGEILPNIRNLLLSNNSFTGSLPSSFGNMSLLGTLDVSLNNFSGEVPKDLFVGCSRLWTLVLSNNYFDGHLDWVHLFNLSELHILNINHNQFSGAMPNELPNSVAISILDVSNNKMSGRIPTWICNLTDVDGILMQNNNFEGQIPCETITSEFLDLSHNLLDGSLPLWSSTRLKHLHLEENNFSGSIPEPFLNMSELWTLDLSDNKLSGSIPSAISKTSNLKILLLGGNHLSGNISTQLCQLTNITLMDLSRNLFSGTIPHCFGHTLSFGIFEIYWGTEFVTPITPFDGTHDLVYNLEVEINFVTKYRLSSYKDHILTYMSGLDLSCNNLTGEIPLELGQLQRIHALNLSHNQLTGSIPKSFSDLTNVESLDLSHNRLSGEIPPQLIELTFLEVFSVAYNNLSGRTPDMKAQFGTFDASSYDGNPFLCGLPLEKNCTKIYDSPTPMHSSDVSDEKWYKVDQTVFFTSFSVTYIMFCLGVITVLYINTHWRLWCYNLVEDCMYSCYFSIAISLRKLSAYLYN